MKSLLETTLNTRDLGGYRTKDGSHVPESGQAVPDSYMKIADAANIRQVFWHIAHATGGALFHCAAGKDRTGVIAAILLLLAEVGESDIVADYMLTKECNQKRFVLFRQKYPDIDINIVIPHEEYIVRFLRLFHEKYDDAQNYLHAIGLSAEEVEQVKEKLVERSH